jgi:hypothetical protein
MSSRENSGPISKLREGVTKMPDKGTASAADVKAALCKIISDKSVGYLLDDKIRRGKSVCSDYMRHLDATEDGRLKKSVVLSVFSSDAFLILSENLTANKTQKKSAAEQAVTKVFDANKGNPKIDRKIVESVVLAFVEALGWDIDFALPPPPDYTLTYDANGGTNAPTVQKGRGIITITSALPWTLNGYSISFIIIGIIIPIIIGIIPGSLPHTLYRVFGIIYCTVCAVEIAMIKKWLYTDDIFSKVFKAALVIFISLFFLKLSYFPNMLSFGGDTITYYDSGFLGMYKTTGTARIVDSDGIIYEGEIVDDKPTGHGVEAGINNDGISWTYTGDFVDGAAHGNGKLVWDNGDVYEGDFVDSYRAGTGIYSFADGDVYEGDFVDDFFSGKGKFTFADGDVFEGEYKEGKRNGLGKWSFANGDTFEGNYVDGEASGIGKTTFANGEIYEGNYTKGERNGVFKVTVNGITIDVEYVNGEIVE